MTRPLGPKDQTLFVAGLTPWPGRARASLVGSKGVTTAVRTASAGWDMMSKGRRNVQTFIFEERRSLVLAGSSR
jgi:hypothetical protein